MKRYKWIAVGLLCLLFMVAGAISRAAPDPGVAAAVKDMFATRARMLKTGEPVQGLERFYDLNVQGGKFALAHEIGRIDYMQAWAPARQLKITEAGALVTNLRVKMAGDKATVSLIARTKLGYRYDGINEISYMGIGSWHYIELNQRDGVWKVAKEFYLDALGDEWTQPYVPPDAKPPVKAEPLVPTTAGRIDREGAVKYAETYCGAAWGCGNNADYNSRYRSYMNLGGDCANFASQTLTVGGKLKPDWVWRHDKEGSTCWVNAQSFVRYLTGSGRGQLLARGTYAQVAPALSKLRPGDIIGYQEKGSITHVSVVTGMDVAGVPIVSAHTADRYRNPWDLGWGKSTVYWLVHLRD